MSLGDTTQAACMISVGNRICVGTNTNKIVVIEHNLDKCSRTILSDHTGSVLHLDKQEPNLLFSSSADKTVKCWNLDSSKCIMTYKDHKYVF